MNTWSVAAVAATALMSMCAAWSCICRMNVMHPSIVPRWVRVQYACLFMACMAALWAPVLGLLGPLMFSAGVLVFLGLGSKGWRNGVPANLRTDWDEFDAKPIERDFLDDDELRRVAGGKTDAPP